MKKVILYLHGKGGNAEECKHFKPFFPDCDIFGIDYASDIPWENKEEIIKEFEVLKSSYSSVILIANSIGAYFAMNALDGMDIKQAYFISPIVNMERLIIDMMSWAGITEVELQNRGEIKTDFGETLSWKYLCYTRENPIKWNVNTEILYGENDNLTSIDTVKAFAKSRNADICVMENGEHWFHTKEQLDFLDNWLTEKAKKH